MLRRHREDLDALDQDTQVLKQEEAENKSQLDQALSRAQTFSQVLAEKLMSVVNEEERV